MSDPISNKMKLLEECHLIEARSSSYRRTPPERTVSLILLYFDRLQTVRLLSLAKHSI
mgnify:CR=1 FL=1